MADKTHIEWADATVNAINGCSVVSPGCTNCYAMRLAGTRLKHHPSRAGLTMDSKAGPVWTGEVRLDEKQLMQPLRWRRPRKIFWNAHGDLFHPAVPDEWIDRVFAVCALTPQHTHMILTKRPERMREYITANRWQEIFDEAYGLSDAGRTDNAPQEQWPLPNVWLATSVEDQARADERIPHLLATPAAKRFLSCEPLLGPVDLIGAEQDGPLRDGELTNIDDPLQIRYGGPRLDWIIVGGESGPGARPMHPDWVRSLRDQCAAAGVPFFFKQWGEWIGGTWSGDGEMVAFSSPDMGDEARAFMRGVADRDEQMCDDSWWGRLKVWSDEEVMPDGSGAASFRVGKKRAGNLLDEQQHLAFPA